MREVLFENRKIRFFYKGYLFTVITLFLIGVMTVDEVSLEWFIHRSLEVIMFIFLYSYLKDEATYKKYIIMFLVSIDFYALVLLQPAVSTFMLVTILPLISIFFFSHVLFYISWISNVLIVCFTFMLIKNFNVVGRFEFLLKTPLDDVLVFLTVQVVIFLVFHFTLYRIKKLKELHEKIRQTEKVNVVSQLAASVAHEIKNPLTVVNGFLQLLEETHDFNEQEKEYVKQMHKELLYTQKIINDYLSLAKLNDGKKEIICVNKEIEDMMMLLSYEREKDISWLIDDHGELHYVEMNRADLKQIILNIMKNAAEAIQQSGYIKVALITQGELLCIHISDNGMGMPADVVNKIGTPFYSLKEKGTGIGLTLVYDLIHKYEGHIQVQSEYGVGTTFRILLPKIKNISK